MESLTSPWTKNRKMLDLSRMFIEQLIFVTRRLFWMKYHSIRVGLGVGNQGGLDYEKDLGLNEQLKIIEGNNSR